MAQRIVRAKAKIRDARIPYQVPSRADLPDRLDSVLHVVYLVFNEGYSASSGASLTRPDLSGEAIRLGRLLIELLPEPEAIGLLALMLLHESRRAARTSPAGELILLDDQDRSLWNRDQIAEGAALVERALASRRFGPYTLQAAIAAVHAKAPSAAATDWAQIVGLYDVLARADPSPVVELNRAVAVAMRDGPAAGLALIDAILARGELADYHLAHSARADLCRRLGRTAEARASYDGPSPSRVRSRSGGFSSDGWRNCGADGEADAASGRSLDMGARRQRRVGPLRRPPSAPRASATAAPGPPVGCTCRPRPNGFRQNPGCMGAAVTPGAPSGT